MAFIPHILCMKLAGLVTVAHGNLHVLFNHKRERRIYLFRLGTTSLTLELSHIEFSQSFDWTILSVTGGGRVVRRCWVNFQCWGVLLIWIIVGQGPVALGVGAGGGCLDIFSLICPFSPLSPSLWETARYRLKYCLKGPLNPKQPTNQNLRHDCVPPGLGVVGWCDGAG